VQSFSSATLRIMHTPFPKTMATMKTKLLPRLTEAMMTAARMGSAQEV